MHTYVLEVFCKQTSDWIEQDRSIEHSLAEYSRQRAKLFNELRNRGITFLVRRLNEPSAVGTAAAARDRHRDFAGAPMEKAP